MARPKADSDAIRARLFVASEVIIKATGGQKLNLSDAAQMIGMTQSNIYRYFRSKDELVAALAQRWFEGVETAAAEGLVAGKTPKQKIRGWLLATMNEKTRQYDNDPVLYLAYLELAKGFPQIVSLHTCRLRELVNEPVRDLVGDDRLESSLDMIENATVLFRNPYLIAAQRSRVTKGNAVAVLDAIIGSFPRAGC